MTTTQALATRAAEVASSLDLKTLGEMFARSGYFDDARQASQAIVKILYGRELGVPPVTAMMGIHIISGKPSASAGLLASRIKSSQHYGYKVKRLDNTGCELDILEDGQVLGQSNFTMEDAKTAGVFEGRNKHTWKAFPRNMFFARAISNACRWYCADLFGGSPVYTPEEMGAGVDEEGNILDVGPPYVPTREQDVVDTTPVPTPPTTVVVEMVTSADSRVWKRWLGVLAEAQGLGVRIQERRLPIALDELKAAANEALTGIAARKEMLAEQDAKVTAAQDQFKTIQAAADEQRTYDEVFGHEAPTEAELTAPRDTASGEVLDAGPPVTAAAEKPKIASWAQHRQLTAEAHKRNLTVLTLNAKTPLELVDEANLQLEQRIRNFDLDQQALAQSEAKL